MEKGKGAAGQGKCSGIRYAALADPHPDSSASCLKGFEFRRLANQTSRIVLLRPTAPERCAVGTLRLAIPGSVPGLSDPSGSGSSGLGSQIVLRLDDARGGRPQNERRLLCLGMYFFVCVS